MTYYDLLIIDEDKIVSTPARDRSEALRIFEKELGNQLTLESGDGVFIWYLLDEWEFGPHWVNPSIPVFGPPI